MQFSEMSQCGQVLNVDQVSIAKLANKKKVKKIQKFF